MSDAEFKVPRLEPPPYNIGVLTVVFREAGPNDEDITVEFGPTDDLSATLLRRMLAEVPMKVTHIGSPRKAGGL